MIEIFQGWKMKNIALLCITLSTLIIFGGCATGAKIVVPSYSAPKEVAKLSKIETKDEFISDEAYLAVWINPEVKGAPSVNKQLPSMLIENVKAKITQTNFIAIDPLGGDESVALSMKVLNYNYKNYGKKVMLSLEVSFTLSRGANEFLVKTYKDRKNRQSNDPSKLPTEDELASSAAAKVVKYFIADISPLKTNQLREFKSLPSELEMVFTYAKRKNYKDAIRIMNNYKGQKDINYHYDLAILYEAQASVYEDMKLLRLAALHYEKAIDMGGYDDKLIVDAKARFDRFYDLLSKTKKQERANKALIDDRDEMTGSSDSEYK